MGAAAAAGLLIAWVLRGRVPAFLIGGGREPEGVAASDAPFVAAASGGPVVVFALEDPQRWEAQLRSAGAGEVRGVLVSEDRLPRAEDLEGAGGIYVAGGETPRYQELLVARGTDWLDRRLPFAGYSAGAAIAARRAVVGGWITERGGRRRPVCDEDAGEGLEAVEVRDGLGLVGLAVDVHCAQWGTLTRLVAAMWQDGLREGAGVDEHTTLEVGETGELRVHGAGAVHHLADGRLRVLVAHDRRDSAA